MGIKEKDLQTVESLQSGDKIRIVTEEGNSRNIDAGAVGGGGMIIIPSETGIDKSYNEIAGALQNGIVPIALMGSESEKNVASVTQAGFEGDRYYVQLKRGSQDFSLESADPDEPMTIVQ